MDVRLYLDEDPMDRRWCGHSGLVLGTQQQYTVGDRMRKLLRLRAEWTAEEMQNRVLFLSSLDR